MEQWVKVPGYEFIEVTRSGRIRSAEQTVTRISRWGTKATYYFKARELKTWLSSNGYRRIVVARDKKRGPLLVHRLIAMAFVPGYLPGYQVNHINGIKLDNRPENLEWVPLADNVRHAWKTGLTGTKKGTAKLTPPRVNAIRKLIRLGAPNNAIALAAGLSPATISAIANGRTWQSVNDSGVEDQVS